MRQTDGPGSGFRHATRRIAALFFISIAAAAGIGAGQAGASQAQGIEALGTAPDVSALSVLSGSPGTASVSATKKRKVGLKQRAFTRKADRICHRQAPFFADLDRRIREEYARYEQAIAAEDFPLAQVILERYGKKVLKIPARLAKREKAIKRLLPVRGKSPRYWLGTLRESSVSFRKLGNGMIALARNPTQANADRLRQATNRSAKASSRYFKAGKNYGFKSCSKPLGAA